MLKIPPHIRSAEAYRGMRIGLLGGSFNPAHEGHVHISLLALKEMGLDAVWWLVSPQNPLKSGTGMAGFDVRFEKAQQITAPHPKIIVSDIETQLGTRFTADTLRHLRLRFQATRFIWMMGADNLIQIPRWQHWQKIFHDCDVAVFRRPPYSVGVLRGMAAQRFHLKRIPPEKAKHIGRASGKSRTTRWVLFSNRLNAQSATQIRAEKKGNR